MKHVLVTGAGGHIGRALSAVLERRLANREIESLSLLDVSLDGAPQAEHIHHHLGDLGDATLLDAVSARAYDTVFHLAGITSRRAEEDFVLGLRVNLQHGVAFLERLRATSANPVLVFASSIGVYGVPLPGRIHDDTPIQPTLSYGTEKRMVELLLADYSRRGWIDARSVRLSGIVARGVQASVALSSFNSDMIREPIEGREYVCPVSPDGHIWLLSTPRCIELLLMTAMLPAEELPASRAFNFPTMRVRVGDLVEAMRRVHGDAVADRVRYEPRPELSEQFAQWPPVTTATANRLGLYCDEDVDALVRRAMS